MQHPLHFLLPFLAAVTSIVAAPLAAHQSDPFPAEDQPQPINRPQGPETQPQISRNDSSEVGSIVPYDQLPIQPDSYPDGDGGTLYKRYQPWLWVKDGCFPYPVVDERGRVSSGLAAPNNSTKSCRNSTGQVYVRGALFGNAYGILYSWYLPKTTTPQLSRYSHPHNWFSIVVWLDDFRLDANMIGTAYSQSPSTDYTVYTHPKNIPSANAAPPLVGAYQVEDDVVLGPWMVRGVRQPLLAWESLTPVAQKALESVDLGPVKVPFTDANFKDSLRNMVLY